ncbi:hypothetical protein STCU_04252 [Strigomonas culicis]|uniref:Uncharacterized protein n=1 Tax=Strigomonas culicis TaxID=28005 RepID=S9UMC9_9TRYP|nr:hypothetical protein STCU_04252 [Strigomonas culicis]|eukprot:EPY30068.1 hypothetical protein STCU_04252 [Strigomonas culicis]
MFAVKCPSQLAWHPAVHHSLLLLRGLRQPHTLLLDAGDQGHALADAHQLLYEGEGKLSIAWAAAAGSGGAPAPLPVVHQPEHIAFLFQMDAPVADRAAVQAQLHAELPDYLDACVVAAHVLRATDALLLALQGGAPELVRRTNAALLDALARLDDAMDVADLAKGGDLPASTWPLFAALQFLIEEGGLLTSSLPRLRAAYDTLRRESPAVRLHHQLVERTLRELGAGTTAAPAVAVAYPHRGFLHEAQRLLSAYTSSVQESVERGVVGERGPPAGRHGRMGGAGRPGAAAVDDAAHAAEAAVRRRGRHGCCACCLPL